MKNLLKVLSLTGGLLITVRFAAPASFRDNDGNVAPYQEASREGAPEYYMLPSDTSLSAAELQQVKALVVAAVKQYNKRIPRRYHGMRILALAKYGIQYRVSLKADGEKTVWINGFCKDDFQYKNLTTRPVFVLDGGSCYFQTTLHLQTNQAELIRINGSA